MKFLREKRSYVSIICLCTMLFVSGNLNVYAAGGAKPNVPELGSEANYKHLEGSTYARPKKSDGRGLFDGTTPNTWLGDTVAYWHEPTDFVDIEFFETINIWRSGAGEEPGWAERNNELKILKYDETDYTKDVTNLYTTPCTQIPIGSWEKFVSNLPPGKYRFKYDKGYRIDSEWYCERVTTTNSALAVLLEVGESVQLSVAENLPDDVTVSWTSSNNEVAIVDGNGQVKALKKGSTQIGVKNADNTFKEAINVIVVPKGKVEELRLTVNLKVEETKRLYLNDDFKNINWSCSDESITTVSSEGKIKGVSKGLVIINAKYKDQTHLIYVRVTE